MTTFISDQEHYEIVLEKMLKAQRVLWIGTADIKDLYVKKENGTLPLLGALSDLLEKAVEVRLIHAKEPGQNFREDFDRYPLLAEGMIKTTKDQTSGFRIFEAKEMTDLVK